MHHSIEKPNQEGERKISGICTCYWFRKNNFENEIVVPVQLSALQLQNEIIKSLL